MKKLLLIIAIACIAPGAIAAPQPNPVRKPFTYVDHAPPPLTKATLFAYLRWFSVWR